MSASKNWRPEPPRCPDCGAHVEHVSMPDGSEVMVQTRPILSAGDTPNVVVATLGHVGEALELSLIGHELPEYSAVYAIHRHALVGGGEEGTRVVAKADPGAAPTTSTLLVRGTPPGAAPRPEVSMVFCDDMDEAGYHGIAEVARKYAVDRSRRRWWRGWR